MHIFNNITNYFTKQRTTLVRPLKLVIVVLVLITLQMQCQGCPADVAILTIKYFPAHLLYSGSVLEKALFLPPVTNEHMLSSCLVQLERCWATCSRCPASDERTTSSTRASLSMRIFCSATTCRPRPHLEDIRPLQPSSSWPQGSTRCSHIIVYL